MDLRYQLNQAQLKKEEAERELRDVSTKTGRQMEKAAQVRITLDLLDKFDHFASPW